mmetsp:Transcript_4099/g.8461  ORF Transcript_4099/g.8461 Transcript_4099/m.8461 type:complete len:201 (+) Transcript_4099:508-1110(+)
MGRGSSDANIILCFAGFSLAHGSCCVVRSMVRNVAQQAQLAFHHVNIWHSISHGMIGTTHATAWNSVMRRSTTVNAARALRRTRILEPGKKLTTIFHGKVLRPSIGLQPSTGHGSRRSHTRHGLSTTHGRRRRCSSVVIHIVDSCSSSVHEHIIGGSIFNPSTTSTNTNTAIRTRIHTIHPTHIGIRRDLAGAKGGEVGH